MILPRHRADDWAHDRKGDRRTDRGWAWLGACKTTAWDTPDEFTFPPSGVNGLTEIDLTRWLVAVDGLFEVSPPTFRDEWSDQPVAQVEREYDGGGIPARVLVDE